MSLELNQILSGNWQNKNLLESSIMAKIGNQILWIVELNQKTGDMSVRTLASAINRNAERFLAGDSLDDIPLAVSCSAKEAQDFIAQLKVKDKAILDLQERTWKGLEVQ